MDEETIIAFAQELEAAGYEHALSLVRKELAPIAEEKGITLLEAALEYADPGENQDTSWYQLWLALLNVP